MSWIAVHGPIGSGKTTLAKALQDTHLRVNFSDLLKEKVCLSLYPWHRVTVADIHRRKEKYRPYIQALGDLIGFTDNPTFIHEALREWAELGRPDCVFDCVRSVEQAETLRAMGFLVVALQADLSTLRSRVQIAPGAKDHPIERPLPFHLVDVSLDASLPVEVLAQQVRAL